MSIARLAAPVLFASALLPACTLDKLEEDVSHEGEACPAVGLADPCRLDGVDGTEFCAHAASNGYALQWSACLTDACEKPDDARACEGGEQYCTQQSVDGEPALLWGVCTDAAECEPGEREDCGIPELEAYMSCALDESGVPRWNYDACNTPLVLSFGGALEFAPAAASAADFDIHGGAGVCTRADWPSAATPWLALDRDRSGSIDGGHELFGTGTRLSSGTAAPADGFAALAELDSNADGKITAADARWSELVLWSDHDGDRRSSAWETLPLAGFEVVEIELAHADRRECDGAGNCGLERARFVYRTATGERSGEVIDVHLACE